MQMLDAYIYRWLYRDDIVSDLNLPLPMTTPNNDQPASESLEHISCMDAAETFFTGKFLKLPSSDKGGYDCGGAEQWLCSPLLNPYYNLQQLRKQRPPTQPQQSATQPQQSHTKQFLSNKVLDVFAQGDLLYSIVAPIQNGISHVGMAMYYISLAAVINPFGCVALHSTGSFARDPQTLCTSLLCFPCALSIARERQAKLQQQSNLNPNPNPSPEQTTPLKRAPVEQGMLRF